RGLSCREGPLPAAGCSPGGARARAQILYWAFLGFTLSDKPLPKQRRSEFLDELMRIANPA
ncbi:MAG TPA: TetR/AcrR family transcriptional regulator, partial [Afipia sp.]|nr:TetR/AcrR family transcriptional regulator [Afipia sp.]